MYPGNYISAPIRILISMLVLSNFSLVAQDSKLRSYHPIITVNSEWRKFKLPEEFIDAGLSNIKTSQGLMIKEEPKGEYFIKTGITNRNLFQIELSGSAYPYYCMLIKSADVHSDSAKANTNASGKFSLSIDRFSDQKLYFKSNELIDELMVLWDNSSIPFRRSGKTISVYLPNYTKNAEASYIRLYASKDGHIRELVIPLHYGKPEIKETINGFNPYQFYTQEIIQDKLKIFLDCRFYCDFNYIKSQLKQIDFVTDRVAADVHILITSARIGSGGNSHQLIFFGQNKYKHRLDTLNSNQHPDATQDENRIQLTEKIKIGLLNFNYKPVQTSNNIVTGVVSNDTIGKQTQSNVIVEDSASFDKWNYWVYKIGADGSYNMDQNYTNGSVSTYLSVNRTTPELKVNFAFYSNWDQSNYKYEDNGVENSFKVSNRNFQLSHFLVKSLNEHWSLGYNTHLYTNTFSNYKSQKYLSAGVEYSIFPYSKVNHKFFTISYSLDAKHNTYFDTTIYDKTSELLFGHKLQLNLTLNQKWGHIQSGIAYTNYFKDWNLTNLSMTLDISLRITGGLSFYMYSYGSVIRDQVYLVKGNATVKEILTKKRQLASSFSVYSGVGISYRFGSIFNNYINPRFSW